MTEVKTKHHKQITYLQAVNILQKLFRFCLQTPLQLFPISIFSFSFV